MNPIRLQTGFFSAYSRKHFALIHAESVYVRLPFPANSQVVNSSAAPLLLPDCLLASVACVSVRRFSAGSVIGTCAVEPGGELNSFLSDLRVSLSDTFPLRPSVERSRHISDVGNPLQFSVP